MKKFVMFTSLLLLTMASLAQMNVSDIPSWYENPPKSSRKYFGVGTGTGVNLEVAEKKAMIDAKSNLSLKVGEVKYLAKDSLKIATTMVKATLRNVRVERKRVIKNKDSYTVFVMVSMKKSAVRPDE